MIKWREVAKAAESFKNLLIMVVALSESACFEELMHFEEDDCFEKR